MGFKFASTKMISVTLTKGNIFSEGNDLITCDMETIEKGLTISCSEVTDLFNRNLKVHASQHQ
jgi:hypothetical protein